MASTCGSEMNPRQAFKPFKIHQEDSYSSCSGSDRSSKGAAMSDRLPLTTSKLANQRGQGVDQEATFKKLHQPVNVGGNNINLLMRRQSEQQLRVNVPTGMAANVSDPTIRRPTLVPSTVKTSAGCSSTALRGGHGNAVETPHNDENVNVAELQKELEEAKSKIAGLNQQLTQQQITQHSVEQAMASPEPVTIQIRASPTDLSESLLRKLNLTGSHSPVDGHLGEPMPRQMQYETEAFSGDNLGNMNLGRAVSSNSGWNGQAGWNGGSHQSHIASTRFDQSNNAPFPPVSRTGSGTSLASSAHHGWNAPYFPTAASNTSFTPPMTPFEAPQSTHAPFWQPRPAAAPFAPSPLELTAPWNSASGNFNQPPPQQYMAPTEPINYRRLLDRNVSCSWKYIVDKIICSNDQQASIFLQQKLKVSPPDLKYELVDAIINQAYPLMVNRFGNFLIQRCLEHGSDEQVATIANTIRGRTLELSMDAFGCHVVQKALDVVPETYKASMVHELLRQIPQTVVHRYACHVWQKLFELRWTESPPQIMRYVNDALHGMWHEVALGETGSLVVQNIFENCLEEDKRPCVAEVLQHIDLIAHGQFGNWCIQHICEHGSPVDKSRAVEHVIQNSTSYSTDQFASKVVEKCLKVGGIDFLDRYLEKVCEARPDRPRMPLIDISGDQYGNYLIQHILLNTDNQHREAVAQHIRKHMVSLRGSKFGSRVALLCCHPNLTTRPGPGVPFNDRFYHPYNGPVGRGPMNGACR